MTSLKRPRAPHVRAQRIGMIQIAGAALLWGTVGVVISFLYTNSPLTATLISFYRMSLATPVLVCTLLYQHSLPKHSEHSFHLRSGDIFLTGLTGILLALYQLFYVIAIDHLGVAIATLVTLCSGPVFVALLSWFILRERLILTHRKDVMIKGSNAKPPPREVGE